MIEPERVVTTVTVTQNEAASCVQTDSEVQGPGNSRGSETMEMSLTISPSPTDNGAETTASESCIDGER